VALGQRAFAEEDLAAGRLVEASPHALPLGHGYCAVYPASRAQRPGLQPLIRWLASAATNDPQIREPRR
jgi:DNA-binding transcriptional LysR family regulator